jgi:energy-converting hydrogenase Eha subunit E
MKRSRNVAADRRRRKMLTILWTAVLGIGTIILIYKEMTALLYILATIGVTTLLVIVAMSDLAHSESLTNDHRRSGDSAAIGSGITSTIGNNPS